MGAKNRRQGAGRGETSAPRVALPSAPASPEERRLLAKSRVYMLLFALVGFLVAAWSLGFPIYAVYEGSRRDRADYGFEEQVAPIGAFTVGRSLFYSVAFGSISLALWKWAVAKRAARDGQISREALAARQLSFWRVSGCFLILF